MRSETFTGGGFPLSREENLCRAAYWLWLTNLTARCVPDERVSA